MTHPATTPQPIAQPGDPARMHRADARSTLAAPLHDIASVAAIICAFGCASLGIILGHAAEEARRTGRQPSGPATGGMVPGYIFTAIGLITAAAIGAALAHAGASWPGPTGPASGTHTPGRAGRRPGPTRPGTRP